MPASRPANLVQYLRRLAGAPAADRESDARLLERFAHDRDGDAFAALVARHGPMVLRLCRRVLADPHAAEDACQAAFLVLARRAGSLRRPEALAGWLYGVAYRVAQKARAAAVRRQGREAPTPDLEPLDPHPDPLAELSARELLAVVDEEVQKLPEVYRLPVILCCLEGHTREEAAQRLSWSPGAVKGRLERGRARLHARLLRRGLTLSAALAGAEAARALAAPRLPAAFVEATARAGLAFAASSGSALPAEVSATVADLARSGLPGLAAVKLKIGLAVLLSASVLTAGGALSTGGAPDRGDRSAAEPPAAVANQPPEAARADAPTRKDAPERRNVAYFLVSKHPIHQAIDGDDNADHHPVAILLKTALAPRIIAAYRVLRDRERDDGFAIASPPPHPQRHRMGQRVRWGSSTITVHSDDRDGQPSMQIMVEGAAGVQKYTALSQVPPPYDDVVKIMLARAEKVKALRERWEKDAALGRTALWE